MVRHAQPYNSLLARRRFFVDAIRGGRGGTARRRGAPSHPRAARRSPASSTRSPITGRLTWRRSSRPRGESRGLPRGRAARARSAGPVRVTLCAALIKFDRFEWIVEKATELGVERILPVETARSEKGLFEASAQTRERWAAHRARKQPAVAPRARCRRSCRRCVSRRPGDARPTIAISSKKPARRRCFAHLPGATAPPADGCAADRPRRRLDGCRTPGRARRRMAGGVGSGPRILRAETAAVAPRWRIVVDSLGWR